MTSEKVLLATIALLTLSGCGLLPGKRSADPLLSPYETRRIWAVAPLRNESGSLRVDGAAYADQLVRQLENAANIDVVPVNRVLEVMSGLRLAEVTSPEQARKVMSVLGADNLVVGTVTAYDPYDPPKLGMALELYECRRPQPQPVDVRALSHAAVDETSRPGPSPDGQTMKQRPAGAPVSSVSGYFDASDPDVSEMLERYGTKRGVPGDKQGPRRYRISMDLYSEFVSYVMSWRLLREESQRLAPTTQPSSDP